MLDVIIIGFSIVVQFFTAVIAFWFMWITGRYWVWITIAVAFLLMAIKNISMFYSAFIGHQFSGLYHFYTAIVFLFSIFMLVGIVGIAPKKEQEKVKRHIEFEKLLGQISLSFAEGVFSDINKEIQIAISMVGEFIHCDHAYVILIAEKEKIKKCIYAWQREGVEAGFQCLSEYPDDFLLILDKVFKYKRLVYVEDVNALNVDWAKEKEQWIKRNVKSSVCVSLEVQNRYLGYICFEFIAAKKPRNESDISLLKTVSEIIAVALVRKRTAAQLEKMAKFDVLTSLPNRYQFGVVIKQMLAYSIRHKLVLAVLSMDLDNFKNVNDTYGHMVGDMLLKEVGMRCQGNIRAEDFISRMGGDEFVIMAFGLKEPKEAEIVAKKLIDVIQGEYILDGHSITTTTSIGIACYPMHGQDQQTLLKNSDIAMYNAKNTGKNRYKFFTQKLQKERRGQLDLENEIQVALNKKEFFLVYQPQFDKNKKVIGMEALLRWRHPIKGLLLPAKYIVIAENSGLIVPLGKWVLEVASRQYRQWYDMGVIKKIRMSINLSFRQIEKDSLASCKDFFDIIKKSKGVGSNFELELTETTLMENPDKSREILQDLHNGGFGIAIDDFGTGYSSLQYLKYLPVQRIKIDRSFINGIGVKREDEVIIETAILLAKKLGFAVIAEGVETVAQFEFLKKSGCTQFQGYWFSYPLEAEEMVKLLQKNVLCEVAR